MGKLWKDNSLTIVLMLMFGASLVGQWLMGWQVENEDLQRHGVALIGPLAYLSSPPFISALFENWESEFLQMGVYVILTAVLVQRGSAESKDPDKGPRDAFPSRAKEAPALAKRADTLGWIYAHGLGLALTALFLASFVLHWTFSAKAAAAESLQHGEAGKSVITYLGDPQLWFESFQNWQSEFLSTAVLVVFSIFLRHRNSPESKSLAAPDSQTGA